MNLQELLKRKAEIREMLADETRDLNLDDLEKELREINEKIEAHERRSQLQQQATDIVNGNPENRTIDTFNNTIDENENQDTHEAEKRGLDLLENRAITVASGDLVLPKHTAKDIKGTFNQTSSLIDRVTHVPLEGGESYERPYEKGHGTGDYSSENAEYNTAESEFDYATISKTKITAYSEETEEVTKLPAANYSNVITGGINKALRRKITREILIGTGAAGRLVGIFSEAASAISADTDIEIAKIDASTLDNIIYAYGGDEDVEDAAVLILNKHDLKAFATLRTTDGKKVYEVKPSGNTGTIDGVPFIINSACASISSSATVAGVYAMAYGPLSNYELATFSPTEIKRSTDYKFKQGMIAHRGSVFIGGNVVAQNGFLRVKKAEAI
ncbi:phage major capsid protein [Lysinibacillus fusiformis]|uniref:phage major capsid protein n=1 Tax=Lysinibacillus fusiformis TaxID=28031 RepID=UPI001967BEEE|nr:phage major capsid protein [Lysinibacillus fusiformis]QSB10450.1 phage major capsid protein [Lysinibacillus fusiformis]